MEVTSGFIAFFPFSFFKPHYLHSIWEKHWINPGAILPLWVHIVTRAEIGKYWQRLAKNTLTVLGRHRCRWEAKLENDFFLKKKMVGMKTRCWPVLRCFQLQHKNTLKAFVSSTHFETQLIRCAILQRPGAPLMHHTASAFVRQKKIQLKKLEKQQNVAGKQ